MIAGVALFAAACWWPGGRTASAQALPFEPGTDVAFEQKLGAAIPADLAFRNEDGQPVTLGAFLSERPVALMLVQYRCPMLCNVALDGAVRSLKAVSLDPGRDFRVLVVSFDPREGPRLARQKRDSVLERYDRPRTEGGWHFLTGEKDAIERLTAAVGFRYVYEADDDRYAHPAGLVVLTPGGRISRYLLGIDPPVRDLRLALVEASEGRIGTLSDRVLLLCYAWDPAAGRYGFAILTAVRIGGVLTVAALAAGITLLLRRERRRQTSRTSNIEHPALNLEPSGSRPSTLDSRPSP
ncbi:MAG TPA: SCO family protein [Planctomycetaceae bacterium]|nr:SCO family protein [Planctomycetaceae bacterium]